MADPTAELFDVDARRDPFLTEYERARELLQGSEWRRGLEEMEALAYRGSIMSILLVADAMREGWMYDQNLTGAENWYRVAVESGSARGLCGLGLTHLEMKRFDEAIEELEAAIAQEYPPAYNALAVILFNGEGVPSDRQRAFELWRAAASIGHLPSRRNLVVQSAQGQNLWRRIAAAITLVPVVTETRRVRAISRHTDRLR